MPPSDDLPPADRPPPAGRGGGDGLLPDVSWGLRDVIVGTMVTMLVVVSILSFGGVVGAQRGFDTAVAAPAGYLVGGMATALALLLVRATRSPLWPLALALAAGVGVVAASYLVASDTGDGTAILAGVPVTIITATAMSGAFAATGMALSVVRYREPLGSLGFVRTQGLRPYLFATGMWMIGLAVLVVWLQVMVWFGIDSLTPPDTARKALDQAGGSIVITVLLVGIAGPIAEEIFFRGFVFTGLFKRFGTRRALFFSSLLFGLFHIDPGAIVPTFVLGLALGWVYLKTGSIWPAMFAHGLHNTVAVLIARYAPAP